MPHPPKERAPAAEDRLVAAQDRFVAVWGQMAGAWGISRTMAEVYALLYITGNALCTDDVMERLQISRGNASMSLRALMEWGIVSRDTRRGDRKEYFRAEQDVWTVFRAIVRERLAREVDPLLASLHEIRDMTTPSPAPASKRIGATPNPHREHQQRLDEMLAFFETVERLGIRFVSPSGKGLRLAATLLTTLAPRAPKPTRPTRREQ